MKIVYFGSSDFAIPALEALADHVVLVVSQPDQPKGRGMEASPTPVKARALSMDLPVETPEKCRDKAFVERIRSLEADMLMVAAYGQILSESLLGAAKRGGINIHGSLLPKYRGAAPIQRAVEAGEMYTGVTLMQMDKGLDTGAIIAQEICSISPDDTAGDLFPRLAELGAQLAVAWAPSIAAGVYPRRPQDSDLATHAAKLAKEDGRLIPTMDALSAYRRHRAVTPHPGSWLETPYGRLKVRKARLVQGVSVLPGQVAATKPELVVGFAAGCMSLVEVQPEGRKPMSGAEFANGARIQAGDSFTV